VYVRLLNKGSQDMTNVRVDVYYAPTSTLVTPNTWRSIGATIAPLVPAGNVLTVPAPILWSSIFMPFAGHYCFVAVASSADDPAPVVTSFATFDEYTAFIRNNNNVASRNFNVYSGPKVPIDGGYIVAGVQIRGGFRSGRRFGIQGSGRLPAGSRVYLDVPAWLADALKPHQVEVSYDAKRGTARIPMNPSGTSDLGVAYLHADSVAECTLGVLIPKKYAGNQYEYFVRQIDGEVEVGRVTWMFAPDEKAPQATASSKKRSSNI
jgi:hypothetical protein